ncbi:MAG: tripartite tricarboxylate transporter permease [Thermodesulfobacteriota bacterium]
MELVTHLAQALNLLLSWGTIYWTILGLAIGIVLGSLPGVSGVLAITLLLGPSYYMDPLHAIIFFTAIYTGSIYGGGITAILLNIPGTPAAIATGFDGYEMTKLGRHNQALGLGIISSVMGVFFSYLMVLFFFFPLGKIVLKFGPAEMVMVVIFAMTSIGAVRGEIMATLLFGMLGIMVGTIGSSAYGSARGNFGIDALYEGIPIIPALLGMLAVSELMIMLERPYVLKDSMRPKQKLKEIIRGMASAIAYKGTVLRGVITGTVIGLMPAAGSTIASMVSYGMAKRASPKPESFGQGNPEGVIAAETANNASEGGAVATMMLLGIPGSVTTALLIAAFMIHGMSPGPFLIREHLDFAYAVILIQFFQAGCLLFLATIFVNYFARIVYLPTATLVPGILILAVVGALAPRGLLVDVVVMLLFAALGYFMKKLEYPLMGFILGFILGGMFDRELIKAILLFEEDLGALWKRPAFLILVIITVLSIIWPKISAKFKALPK